MIKYYLKLSLTVFGLMVKSIEEIESSYFQYIVIINFVIIILSFLPNVKTTTISTKRISDL